MLSASAHAPTAALHLARCDDAACLSTLRAGSRTFFLASRLLPRDLLADFAAIYAFCREADDQIDLSSNPGRQLALLQQRLATAEAHARVGNEAPAWATAGVPQESERLPTLASATDRALVRTLRRRQLTTLPLRALLEGFAWDAQGNPYPNLAATLAYAARAAGSVGVLLAQLMGVRAPWALARAADMGVAMQLTNICRDVGEDARAGRVYLPETWLRRAGVDPQGLRQAPAFTPALGLVVARLLRLADALYGRAREGLAALPLGARLAVAAAQRLYADIGRSIRRRGFDSVSSRAVVPGARRAWLLMRAVADVPRASLCRPGAGQARGPLAACAFLLAPGPVARGELSP